MQNKELASEQVTAQPQVAVIMVILTVHEDRLKVLLYRRDKEPFEGQLSLPAGLILKMESLDEAALRVLKEKTGISRLFLEQLYTFGDPERDPHKWTIGVAYYALINFKDVTIKEPEADWFEVNSISELAFDHNEVLKKALDRTRSKMMYSNILHGLLPEEFTLTQLQKVYELLLDEKLDKRNFRKKILSLNILIDTNRKITGNQRPAALFKFKTVDTVVFKTGI